MREYRLPDGTLVPAELQEQIADDVRAFDYAQTPDAKSAVALRKIGNELPRIRAAIAGEDELAKHVGRLAVAWEIVALGELGFPPERLVHTMPAHRLMVRYGLLDQHGEPHL
jgi:hypothetical protein